MARIITIKPPCGYVVEGVAEVRLLDFEDFKGLGFANGRLYGVCLVTSILRVAEFTTLPETNGKYSSASVGSLEAHTLQIFVNELSAQTLSNLTLGRRRRYVVVFKLNNGKYYLYGYGDGAELTYTNQSADGIGSLVTITSASEFPLFEVSPVALVSYYTTEFVPDFINGAFCEIN